MLGQKEAYNGIKDIPTNEEEEKALNAAHVFTVEFIKKFRGSIIEIFEYYCSSRKDTKSSVGSSEEDLKRVKLKYSHFSDYVQMYVPLYHEKDGDYYVSCVNGILGILMACGGMLLISLAEKHAFRVGIDVGIGVNIEENEVYGPALFNAYLLESRISQYPRIVVGDTLIDYLSKLKQGERQFASQETIDIEACKLIGTKCLNMISIDGDGIPIVDYLGAEFIKLYKTFPGDLFNEVYEKAKQYVENEYRIHKEKRNIKLALRYERLSNYFKSRPIDS